jgi:hypothetical protein
MPHRYFHLRIVAVLAVLTSEFAGRADSAPAQANGPISPAHMLHRLKTEALPQWREMARKLESSRFDYTVVETNRTGRTNLAQTKQVTGQLAGDCFLFTEMIESTAQASVYGRNDRYEFALNRTDDSPWMVTWQSARCDEDTPVGSAYAYLAGMLQRPWSISATPLERLVTDSRFSVRSVKQGENGDVQIEFSVQPSAVRPDPLQGLAAGTVVLDSSHHWAIQRYQVTYTNKMSSSLELTYGAAGPPELRHVEFELKQSPGNTSKFSIVAGKYEWTAARSAEFTLPAFGLPEFRSPRSTRRWIVLLNIGIICILVGLILYRRKHESAERRRA